jgi:glyoxylase-like metal-dependent hydrolase (beta-lactamase superfamily II)
LKTTAAKRFEWVPATIHNKMRLFALLVSLLLWGSSMAQARDDDIFKVVKVNERVYALVGELGQRSPQNLGNNMTSGFIIADEGVVVVDTGGSKAGAEVIANAVRRVTDKPILWAINTGGQDHRWLGNDHFQTVLKAKVIASEAGKNDMVARTFQQVDMAKRNIGERFEGTRPAYPDVTFTERHKLAIRGVDIELIYTGGAHTPGDILVWLAKDRIVFTGDVVFTDRLLGIQPGLGLRWISALERLRDDIKPQTVVPGHGNVSTLDKPLADSLGYLLMLRDGTKKAIAGGAFDPVEVSEKLDQSRFSYLQNYDDSRFRSENAIRMAEEVFAADKK